MWTGYYYKIEDSWVPPLQWAPRWFDANGYGTLTDYVAPPSVRSSVTSGTFVSPSGSILPYSWALSSVTPTITGSILQRFFEVFVNEKEFIVPTLTSLQLSRQMFFDIAEPEYAWILSSEDLVETIQVVTTNGTSLVERAYSDLDLFYSGSRRWKQENNIVLLYGLDIQTMVDTASGYWHFIDSQNLASTGALYFMEHPITKNWFPIHPLKVRSDGFVNFYYNGEIRFRAKSPRASKLLEEVTVYVNGVQKQARRIALFNSVDEKALHYHLSRRYGESNAELGETIVKKAWFHGQNFRGLRSALSASLRTGQIITVAASASSFSLPATSTGFMIKNLRHWDYYYEVLASVVSGTNSYYSIISSGDISCGYVRQAKTDFTSVSGVITFDTYLNAKVERPLIHWKVPFVTATSAMVYFTENLNDTLPDFYVFLASKVDVKAPDTSTLRKSFTKNSPSFKWSRNKDNLEVVTGLAEFDF